MVHVDAAWSGVPSTRVKVYAVLRRGLGPAVVPIAALENRGGRFTTITIQHWSAACGADAAGVVPGAAGTAAESAGGAGPAAGAVAAGVGIAERSNMWMDWTAENAHSIFSTASPLPFVTTIFGPRSCSAYPTLN